MNTYIVRYAPLDSYGAVIQDFKIVKILSESNDISYIKSEFERRCDSANNDSSSYKGMFVVVKTLDDYLDSLPSDVI